MVWHYELEPQKLIRNLYVLLFFAHYMNINFFEEFPTTSNLKKLELVTFPTTVYVATPSIAEFIKIKTKLKKNSNSNNNSASSGSNNSNSNDNLTLAWWPTLSHKEGYWLSPFSTPTALKRIMDEILNYKGNLSIMWDAELPFRHPWLFLRLDSFFRNSREIRSFLRKCKQKKNVEILTSEYPIRNGFTEFFLRSMGVSISPKKYGTKKIVMYYTSMHPKIRSVFKKGISSLNEKYKGDVHVGLGTIATGILETEPILPPNQLKRDLKEIKEIGIEDVVIFRLGGLNKKYVNVLSKFT